jgi:tetratricopeptide (TPR) repeat protein
MSFLRGTRGVMGFCCLGWFLLLLLPGYSHAAECQQWVAKAVSIQGTVQVQRNGTTTWQAVLSEDPLCAGDVLRVLKNSRAALVLRNEAVIRLDEKTTLTIKPEPGSKALLLRLLNGAVHFFSRIRHSLNVATPFVNGAVEGTEFFVRVSQEQTYFSVFRGRVRIENTAGDLLLADNTTATAAKGQAPVMRAVARPRDAVNWALYYPTIIPTGDSIVSKQLVSASESLQVGRVDTAQKLLNQIINNDPNNSAALALSAIIELVQNRKEKARILAEKAIELKPDSSVAKMALACVRQAFFEIKAARDILVQAVSVDPENALLWARLSELWLATGYQGKALSAAKKASSLSPTVSRSQTVLGFAYISQIKIKKAKEAFHKAIDLDQADPLSRMGLGLALIRGGDLERGREQIEIAAALDPGNALIRSYLGKAFFDEKEGKFANRQYEVAKELDPNDPTAYFYSAIQKQAQNRPVEALNDLQKSIELNHNRAVYRSKLLLDDDLASRSASLGRLYKDLGFQQLGLVEGWKSVNTAPSNYSAHRFLSDTYAAIPRHQIGRVSELLQSQLLQPLNITPLQPQLGETGLFIYEGLGPSETALNEYNALFLRNRLALLTNGVVAEKDSWGDDIVISAIWNHYSISAGQFHYETDGFRDNNDETQDIYNAFTQVNLSPTSSLQAEYRYANSERGDMELTFTGDYNPDLRQEDEVQSLRLGLRQEFQPRSNLLLSFMYQDGNTTADVIPGFFKLSGDIDFYITEIRYLHHVGAIHMNAGGGYRQKDSHEEKTLAGNSSEEALKTEFTNVYLYGNLIYPSSVTWTIGASSDFLCSDKEGGDDNQVNPKLGVIWNPLPALTLRGAVFRTLNKPFISEQSLVPTLEPSQVAGFNQYYLGDEGEDTWLYGLGIDQKFSASITGGLELAYRDIEAALVDATSGDPYIVRQQYEERLARAYLYWTPWDYVAFSAEYLYERFDRDIKEALIDIEQFSRLRTQRLPLGINVFHPNGLRAGVEAVYVDQAGTFFIDNPDGAPLELKGDDQFWVFNASAGYKFPKRIGLISLEARNLFDKEFQFQDIDPSNPRIVPERVILLKLSLAF